MALVVFTLLISGVFSTGKVTKIIYRVAGRQLPSDKNLFAEIQKNGANYCRTESIKNSNPDWQQMCEAEFQEGDDNARLGIEIRSQRTLFPDESIGFSAFKLNEMLQSGVTLSDEVRDGSSFVGETRLTVLVACVPGEPNCGLYEQYKNQTKPVHFAKLVWKQ